VLDCLGWFSDLVRIDLRIVNAESQYIYSWSFCVTVNLQSCRSTIWDRLILRNLILLQGIFLRRPVSSRGTFSPVPRIVPPVLQRHFSTGVTTGWPQKLAQFLFAVISSNIDHFSNLFHCRNQEKICNNILPVKIAAHLKVCHYTTLWNVRCPKSNNWNKTTSVTKRVPFWATL